MSGGGWKTYTLVNHEIDGPTTALDTGIALYQMREWELTASFTMTKLRTGIFASATDYILTVGNDTALLPQVRAGSKRVYLGSTYEAVNTEGVTMTLTASWKAGVGGTASLTGGSVSLTGAIAGTQTSTDTFRVANNALDNSPKGTIHSLIIKYH